MAKIGNVFFGGLNSADSDANAEVYSAVGFSLNNSADAKTLYPFEENNWVVETEYGNNFIVARTLSPFPTEELLTIGYEQIQRALDMAAYEGKTLNKTGNYDDPHWMIYRNEHAKLCLRYTDIMPWGSKAIMWIQGYDRSGNLIIENKQNDISWARHLRFYRLSQMARDIREAYIFLYLGFESILNQIYPKESGAKKHTEGKWLKEALEKIGEDKGIKYLHKIGESNIDVKKGVEDFFENQYSGTRNKIFHAKRGFYATTDDATIKPIDVTKSYKLLLNFFRQIVNGYYPVRRLCGVMEHEGFYYDMDRIHESGFQVYFTDDPSPASVFDTEVSPRGYPIYPFTDVEYRKTIERAEVEFVCTVKVDEDLKNMTVKRICSKYQGIVARTSSFSDGILLDGINVFEYIQKIRLVDYGSPRTDFMEGAAW